MLPQNDDELAFLSEILAHPEDESVRAIYADWLDERGDSRAEILRIESVLATTPTQTEEFQQLQNELRRLRRGVNHNWIVVVTRVPIENCDRSSSCPGRWERLGATHFPDVRVCWECQQNVYYCRAMREARQHVSMRRPIAVSLTLNRAPNDLLRR